MRFGKGSAFGPLRQLFRLRQVSLITINYRSDIRNGDGGTFLQAIACYRIKLQTQVLHQTIGYLDRCGTILRGRYHRTILSLRACSHPQRQKATFPERKGESGAVQLPQSRPGDKQEIEFCRPRPDGTDLPHENSSEVHPGAQISEEKSTGFG